jgi:hypothetical protein
MYEIDNMITWEETVSRLSRFGRPDQTRLDSLKTIDTYLRNRGFEARSCGITLTSYSKKPCRYHFTVDQYTIVKRYVGTTSFLAEMNYANLNARNIEHEFFIAFVESDPTADRANLIEALEMEDFVEKFSKHD